MRVSLARVTRQAAIRQITLMMAVCFPLAVLGFLWGGAFFDSYQGEVVAWRPLQAADGQDDKVKRFLLVRPQGQYEDIELPAAAFAGHDLPVSISGVPPMETLKNPPQVRKEPFTFSADVDDKTWSTLGPQDVLLPLLFLVAVLLGRNVLFAGSPFELVPPKGGGMPKLHRPPSGTPEPVKTKGGRGKGPPPQGKKGKSKGSRANRRRKKK